MTPALSLVVCGAPLAARASEVAAALVDAGWTVSVVGSSASRAWLDVDAVQAVVGRPVLFEQRQVSQAAGVRPAAVVACPLTMNSASKAATGVMDTYGTGILCDALAMRLPRTVVVTVSSRLWGHPAWSGHLDIFRSAGARFVSPISGRIEEPEPVQSGTGEDVVAGFDPLALVRAVGSPVAG